MTATVTNTEIATELGHVPNKTKSKTKDKVTVVKPKAKMELDSPAKFEYADAITAIGDHYMKLEDSINLALERGRALGLSDIQIGDDIRSELTNAGRSRMNISRYLPATAKHKVRGKTSSDGNTSSKVSNNMLQNKPKNDGKIARLQYSESNRYQEENNNREPSEWQSNETWQIPLHDAKPEDVDKYDEINCKRLLREALIFIENLTKVKEPSIMEEEK